MSLITLGRYYVTPILRNKFYLWVFYVFGTILTKAVKQVQNSSFVVPYFWRIMYFSFFLQKSEQDTITGRKCHPLGRRVRLIIKNYRIVILWNVKKSIIRTTKVLWNVIYGLDNNHCVKKKKFYIYTKLQLQRNYRDHYCTFSKISAW